MVPSLQRALFLKFVPGSSVERFSIGPSQIRLENLNLIFENADKAKGGAKKSLFVKNLWIKELSLLKCLRGRIEAKSFTISGLSLNFPAEPLNLAALLPGEASQSDPFGPQGSLVFAGFSGAKPMRVIPITLETLEFDGTFSVGGQVASTASASGGGFAPGKEGQLAVDFECPDTDLLKPLALSSVDVSAVKRVQTHSALKVAQASSGRIDRITQDQDVTLTPSNRKAQEEKLKIRATLIPQEDFTAMDLDLQVLDLRKNEAQLFSFKGPLGAEKVAGAFTFSFASGQLGLLLQSLKLPQLALKGEGSVDIAPGKALDVNIKASGNVAKMGLVDARLNTLPPMDVDLTAALTLAMGASLQVKTLGLKLNEVGGSASVLVEGLKPFTVDLKDLVPTEALGSVLKAEIKNLPVLWAQGFLSDTPVGLKGAQVGAIAALEAKKGAWGLDLQSSFAGLSVQYEQKPALVGIGMQGRASGHYEPHAWSLKSKEWSFFLKEKPFLKSEFAVSDNAKDGLLAQGNLHVWPGLLADQPIAKDLDADAWPQAQWDTFFDVALGEEVLRVNTLETLFQEAEHAPLLELKVKPGLTFLKKDLYSSLHKQGKIASGSFNQVPLSLISPLLPGMKIGGSLERFAFECYSEGESVFFKTLDFLQINGLEVHKDKNLFLKDVDILLKPAMQLDPKKFSFDLGVIEIKQGEVDLLQAGLLGYYPSKKGGPSSVQFKLFGDLPQLVGKSFLKKRMYTPRSGTLALEAELKDLEKLQLKFELKDLKHPKAAGGLALFSLSAQAGLDAQGRWSATVPLHLQSPSGASDVELNGFFQKNRFELNALGPQILVDDFIFLSTFMKEGEDRPEPPKKTKKGKETATEPVQQKAPRGADLQPFWAPYEGVVALDIKRISLMRNTLEDFKGRLMLSPDALTLDPIEATQAGAPLKAKAVVAFKSGDTEAYHLDSIFSLTRWNLGAVLQKAVPQSPPAVEGVFSIQAKATGAGPTLEEMLASLAGDFSVSGGPGVLRALANAGGGAKAGAAIGGLALGVLGGATNRPGLTALSRISGYFDELPYDTLSCSLGRETGKDVVLKSLALDGPVAGVRAQGRVGSQKNKAFMDQTLALTIDLGAKGPLAEDLQSINIASGRPGEGDYFWATESFEIGGSPANPDTSKLWGILRKAALGAVTQSGDSSGQNTEGQPIKKAQDAIQGLFKGLF